MPYFAELRTYFSSDLLLQGSNIASQNQVRVFSVSKDSAYADVFDSEDSFEVDITIDRGLWEPVCPCRTYMGGSLCSHIWAVFVVLERSEPSFASGSEFIGFEIRDNRGKSIRVIPQTSGHSNQKIADRNKSPQFWRSLLQNSLNQPLQLEAGENPKNSPDSVKQPKLKIWYQINLSDFLTEANMTLTLLQQSLKKNGDWGKARPFSVSQYGSDPRLTANDQEVIDELLKITQQDVNRYYYHYHRPSASSFTLVDVPDVWKTFLKKLALTNRLVWRKSETEDSQPIHDRVLRWSSDRIWELGLRVSEAKEGKGQSGQDLTLEGFLKSPEGALLGLDEPIMLIGSGLVFLQNQLIEANISDDFPWVLDLRQANNRVTIPAKDRDTFVQELYLRQGKKLLELPDSLKWAIEEVSCQPKLTFIEDLNQENISEFIFADLLFCYGEFELIPKNKTTTSFSPIVSQKKVLRRDEIKEYEALLALDELGFSTSDSDRYQFQVKRTQLVEVSSKLIELGWAVSLGRRAFRGSSKFDGIVSSGIDWFEMTGKVTVGGLSANIPTLLASLRKGDHFVTLSDGSLCTVPDALRKKLELLAKFGKESGDAVRFTRSQAIFLDQLIEESEEISTDSTFAKLRMDLKALRGVKPKQESVQFNGNLRGYQRLGLGWLHFLEKFGFGGCIADEMGLGKTVQVLAHLASYYKNRKGTSRQPTLVVMPRSLIHNWEEEIKKFTGLKALDYTQPRRKFFLKDFLSYDLVLTTYTILRNDISSLMECEFSYVILDEAQAIKNPGSNTAKAARLLKGHNKLCMTGTPIENHLGDLWSIFAFLNPGFMSTSTIKGLNSQTGSELSSEDLDLVSRAVQPFILRRTKTEVLKDLPEKIEQTLYCDLPKNQRLEYDELRTYYRTMMDKKIKTEGLSKSKFFVLEAILRLRQAACHPGLLNSAFSKRPSAKTDVLLDQLASVIDGGSKALVFSQFTGMLEIVKYFLTSKKIAYEYLDGATKDRQECVFRFQNDPACHVFLISIKAGGVGLNLTAADYCFILDPWWNPAIEAQAVDRAHRIGQKKRVFSYKLIARDTVEERILTLQAKKKTLAKSIINNEGGFLKSLSGSDLDLLLS